jgi:hypothetical protein
MQMKFLTAQGDPLISYEISFINDEELRDFSNALALGALTNLLQLEINACENLQLSPFAQACSDGALPHLIMLDLNENSIEDASFTVFANACITGLKKLKSLSLSMNNIGDQGLIAFSNACLQGAFVNLQDLDFLSNRIENEGFKVFVETLMTADSFLPSLIELNLNPTASEDIWSLFGTALQNNCLPKLQRMILGEAGETNTNVIAASESRGIIID